MESTPTLRPFSEVDFTWVEKWVERKFYIGALTDVPFAFGEIIPQESGWPRLGRILVGKASMRGLGLGSQFVAALVDECLRLYHCDRVDLNVWEENAAAIRCYEKVICVQPGRTVRA
ncbi:GNAT family N-acetyltransferase [Parapedobacter koreensis]|uniref:Acetyltransferase (GNAT) family protein n=1 Tax=Parapedobacter koreensis TaxID=332977 RepID=A0A1H7QMQ4_9SPHI|nr:GNAT family N-acetyltransferase [Parapedobacter koreensis]SEL49196.1 Acetyltransferase (GNAT) family protein [Parapedobacter koreensis]